MPIYKIEVQETLAKTITIEADNETQALKQARQSYAEAEPGWVLSAEDYVDTEFKVVE